MEGHIECVKHQQLDELLEVDVAIAIFIKKVDHFFRFSFVNVMPKFLENRNKVSLADLAVAIHVKPVENHDQIFWILVLLGFNLDEEADKLIEVDAAAFVKIY